MAVHNEIINLDEIGTDNPSIDENLKSSRCYFCYLTQKHICTLAFVAVIVVSNYAVQLLEKVINISQSKN